MIPLLNFPKRSLYLIGARGSGKSTVGRLLSEKLNWPLLETDELVEQLLGSPIPQIVNEQGWHTFRKAETQVLMHSACIEPSIISTGGGIVLTEENRDFMSKSGIVVFLDVSPEILEKRLWEDAGSRPSLTGVHPAKEIAQVLKDREEPYRKLAHLVIFANDSAENTCDSILQAISFMHDIKGDSLGPKLQPNNENKRILQ